MSHTTIVAQCTPRGAGALAVIRISGPDAFSVVSNCSQLPHARALFNAPTSSIQYGWVINHKKERIDQVLFLVMRGPKTFTGFDTIEISCHNNQFVIEAIISQIIAYGAQPAAGGEFTRQAVENGKLDLIQAEAINELIHAQSIAAARASIGQLHGSLSHRVLEIEKELLRALSFCEASFEFIDEEISFHEDVLTIINAVIKKIDALLESHKKAVQIRQGAKVVLVGSVNAGKSSLFNALLAYDRAIVTDIAGTTRDIIEAPTVSDQLFITLADTAGIRSTHDIIEQKGIDRSMQYSRDADVILLVQDQSQALSQEEQATYQNIKQKFTSKVITVGSKADLRSPKIQEALDIFVSSKTGYNIPELRALFTQKIKLGHASLDSPFLINQRHTTLLHVTRKKLQNLITTMQPAEAFAYEIVSFELNTILAQLADLTGKTVSEETMSMVFSEFCVGK